MNTNQSDGLPSRWREEPAASLPIGDRIAERDLNQILESTARAGVHLGLDQIQRLLAKVGSPHQSVPIVHVAGTNGKGSVCAYLSSVLTQAGYRVGRYTSPHLVSWTERICIDETPISLQALFHLLQSVVQTAAAHGLSPTQFEIVTAAAWLHFAQQSVDIAVMEVGLGGRLDATNVCPRPLATAITSIGRDHWQRLGPTVTDIAREKAGILKPQVPAIVAPLPSDAAAVVIQRSQTVCCPLIWVSPAEAVSSPCGSGSLPEETASWARFVPPSAAFYPVTYPLALLGPHQYVNSAVAIALLQQLQVQGWSISPEAIQAGMRQVRWPARLQWTTWQGVPLLIDGAHNADAARALRRYVDEYRTGSGAAIATWVVGMLDTKDHRDILMALLRPGDRVCFVPVPNHQTADPQQLRSLTYATCPGVYAKTAADVFQALSWAASEVSRGGSNPRHISLCGSLYLIGHMLSKLD